MEEKSRQCFRKSVSEQELKEICKQLGSQNQIF